jgi:ferrous iron transport protein B
MRAVTNSYDAQILQQPDKSAELTRQKKAALLQTSFAGTLGKAIEPVIAPLGFDWKIGIALVTSFAAREVFVGTMATLYSVGEGADETDSTLRQKMSSAVRQDGTKVYTLATGLSLLIFYVFAMQCMSTIAIVKRETKSWKWPLVQLAYMTGLAYCMSLLVYVLFK